MKVSKDVAEAFTQPLAVDGPAVAFGGDETDMRRLMPDYNSLPEDFRRGHNLWSEWQRRWFFKGLDSTPEPREGIDAEAAMLHLTAIQRSFAPKHEHKAAAVAYLASLWFKKPTE